MVYLKTEPITAQGKDNAVKRASREVHERFEDRSTRRSWVAKHHPARRQMADLGPLLQRERSEKVTNLLLGEMAVEKAEPDYVQAGIHASGEDKETRRFYENFWGPQERRHGDLLWFTLLDSGLQSAEQLHRYLLELEEADPWTFQKQTGHDGDDVIWGIAYATAQEGQTRLTYHETRRIIWELYGSPTDPTTRRNLYPGVCSALTDIAEDEGAHQGFFLQKMRIFLRYWPDKALEALAGVFHGYKMPIVHIPNAEEFAAAVIDAKLAHPRWVLTEVHNPVAQKLGLESRSAIGRALQNFGNLLDGAKAIVQLPGKPLKEEEIPEGCVVYNVHPDGSFQPVVS